MESTRHKLWRLEVELEDQKKLNDELRIVVRDFHSHAETYENRVVDLENDVASRDVIELGQIVDELEQGCVDFELGLSREKVKFLLCLSEFRSSSSKREEALRAKVMEVRRAMHEAANSFAAEKRELEGSRTGLSLCVAKLSTMPAFPGDLVVLARRCIGVAMAVLEVAHGNERSRFKVCKDERGVRRKFTNTLLRI